MSVHRPVIGITAYPRAGNPPGFAVPCGYVDAVRRAGATPIALPPGDPDPAHYLDLVDALILAGGGDIDPDAYGGTPHGTVYSVCAERDAFELRLIRAALARDDRPILCICRGMQILNVANGGDLHVDIPEALPHAIAHRRPERRPIAHAAALTPESRLSAILGTAHVEVQSWHHQSIRNVGRDLESVAWAQDGVIEAVEHLTHPWCFGVQWHPELQPDDPVQQRLFAALVAEARGGRDGRTVAAAPSDGGHPPARRAS